MISQRARFLGALLASLTSIFVAGPTKAHHPSAGTSTSGTSTMGAIGALRDPGPRAWSLTLGYRLSLQSAEPIADQARVLRPFGELYNHTLGLGVGYGKKGWNVQAQLPVGVSVRTQEGLERAQVWGIGDLRLWGGYRWRLGSATGAPRLLARAGVSVPTGRYRDEDFVEAAYLEPQAQTGALKVRRMKAQTGLGSGVWAGLMALSLGQQWHPQSGWMLLLDAQVPLSKTAQGHRWGADMQARFLMEVSDQEGRMSGFLGPGFMYHTEDRFSPSDAVSPVQELDLRVSARYRVSAVAGLIVRASAQLTCALEGAFALWQEAEAGSMRETLSAQASCRWQFARKGSQ